MGSFAQILIVLYIGSLEARVYASNKERKECMGWFAQNLIVGLGRNNPYIGSLEARV